MLADSPDIVSMVSPETGELLLGLPLLILRESSTEPNWFPMVRHHHHVPLEVIRLEDGSVCPAVHRIGPLGRIRSEWGTSRYRPRAWYPPTAVEEKQLGRETNRWQSIAGAIGPARG